MNYKIHITAHVYAEEELQDDRYLDENSTDYGIVGEEIIAPLKTVNGKTLAFENMPDFFSVRELWSKLDQILYEKIESPYFDNVLGFVQQYQIVEKYLCFNGFRYKVWTLDKPLIEFLHRMGCRESEPIEVQLLVSANAGAVYNDDGIRYSMKSREAGQHNEPHVHVDIQHNESGTFSLLTGEQLQKEEKVKEKYARKIKKEILRHQKEWLIYWNEHTDGLSVDLNQVLGLINY